MPMAGPRAKSKKLQNCFAIGFDKHAGLTNLSLWLTLHGIRAKGQAMCGFVGDQKDIAQLSSQQKKKLEEFLKNRKADVEERLNRIKTDLDKLQKYSKG
jgi:hypothetical protein